ncbi:hypothetical protein [Aquitalea aquatica]|uniref:AAA+ ATPase domain-containing protein n=1 Tax=Aquitalea aquatica TaxID=3044273 RepID=A0A838Y1I1_9NEIS|nr:hypothetical protein [Aquitalea magnusonii]MBA4709280.1 hypothetical protein [Aquitalea magnusonii]
MTAMPSESEIKKAIEALKSQPAKFQVLAENIMRIKFGGKYQNIIPQGRNAALQTTIGYPDAYATDEFQKQYLIEATIGDWRKHLEKEDIPGITKIGGANVAEFALFCMSDSELLIQQKRKDRKVKKKSVDEYKADLAALGVPLAGIRFFFMDQLIKELRQPVYARVLSELGLDIDISPFFSIEKRLFHPDTGPTRSEFEAGDVVADDLIKSMRRALSPGSKLLAEGGSGLGKTTLATAFAFDWLKREQGAFYVDLVAFDDPAAIVHILVQRIKQYGCRAHLFVLDNCHRLAPDLLSQILGAHVAPDDRPTVLAMSRKLTESAVQALCKAHELKRMHIRLRQEDLLAIYRLLARRYSQSAFFTPPTDADMQRWHSLHADLVTFTLAMNGATTRLRAGLVPKLAENDAINHLQARYISNLSANEREMLAVIALCARLDVPASQSSLNGGVPQQSLDRGLVFQQTAKNQMPRYALAHAKIGELLLKCLNVDEKQAWEELIQRDHFQACFIAKQLLDADSESIETPVGAASKAKEVLELVGENAWQFSERFSPGYSGVIASLYRQVGLEVTIIKEVLSRGISRYVIDQESFLIGLPSFLDFAQEEGFDAEITQVWADLTKAAQDGRLEIAACLAPVSTVREMLMRTAKRDEQTFRTLTAAFSSKAVAIAVANKFGMLKPDLAEQVLKDLEKLAPTLHHLLLAELPVGDRLQKLKSSLANAVSPPNIRKWLRRSRLLHLLTGDPALILPTEWLYNRGVIVLELLLGELESLRTIYDDQIQVLIATWASERICETPDPAATAARIRLMLSMADAKREKAVCKRIAMTKADTLKACLRTQRPSELGALLIGAGPVFDRKEQFLPLKSIILEIAQERIEKSIAGRAPHPPAAFHLASHVYVAKLAGAEHNEDWLQPALETLGQAPAWQPTSRDAQRHTRAGRLMRTYWKGVETLLQTGYQEST